MKKMEIQRIALKPKWKVCEPIVIMCAIGYGHICQRPGTSERTEKPSNTICITATPSGDLRTRRITVIGWVIFCQNVKRTHSRQDGPLLFLCPWLCPWLIYSVSELSATLCNSRHQSLSTLLSKTPAPRASQSRAASEYEKGQRCVQTQSDIIHRIKCTCCDCSADLVDLGACFGRDESTAHAPYIVLEKANAWLHCCAVAAVRCDRLPLGPINFAP